MISPEQYGNVTMEHHMQDGGETIYYTDNEMKQEVTSPQQMVVMQDGHSYTEMTTANGQVYNMMGVSTQSEVMPQQQQILSSVTLNQEGEVVENSGPAMGSGSILSMLKDNFQNADGGITSMPSLPSAVFENFGAPNLANNMAILQGESGMVAAEETVESVNEDIPIGS